MATYGFIGLGSQGAPMARQMINAGLQVVLWARRRESLEPFRESPAMLVTSISRFAQLVDYVGICVVNDDGVREVCDRLMPRLRKGSCIVIHSTITPALCRTLAEQAAHYGVSLIDAPVSGGGPAAEAGELTIMVGGDKAILDSIRPVLETFAGLILHLGAAGAGQHGKLINNAMMAANLAIAHHGMEAAELLSLDRASFIDLLNASSGRSFSFSVRARMQNPRDFSHGASLLAKDIALLREALAGKPCVKTIEDTAQSFLKLVFAK